MRGSFEAQAAHRTAPGAATITTGITSAGATTITLASAFVDHIVLFQAADATIHLRFGETSSGVGSATTSDVFLEDGDREEFLVTPSKKYISVISASGTGSLRYATTD